MPDPMSLPMPLHRHQLVRLSDAAWREVCERPWDAEARACLNHWAANGLPLVVTRQMPQGLADGEMALGLAAPLRWQRRRIALVAHRRHVIALDEFPRLDEIAQGAAWPDLCASLAALGVTARVYGSHGWQWLSGLPCAHPESDIDLWTAVADARQADAVAAALDACSDSPARPRLDGELLLPDGRAFAWREWRAWRTGRTRAILAKTLLGASLVRSDVELALQPC